MAREIVALVGSALPSALLLGCTGQSVIGGGREVEAGPGLALLAGSLPGVNLCPFHVEPGEEAALGEGRLANCLGRDAATAASIVLADPFSVEADALLLGLDQIAPGAAHVGGLASGGRTPGENLLFVAGEMRHAGAVGVALSGMVEASAVVAQGCRPIGEPMFVTAARDNLLLGLDQRRPLEILRELYQTLNEADRALFQNSLLLGVAMSDAHEAFGAGDFLIRNLVGSDAESGAIVVGAMLREAQVVQFHLRDASTAEEDFGLRLAQYVAANPERQPSACLLFSCLGRGEALYGQPDFESALLGRHLPTTAVGGFFCNGEIGPVGGRTFLHGYTSSMLMLGQSGR